MSELKFPEYGAAIRWTEHGAGRPLVVLPGLSLPVGPPFEALVQDSRFADRRFVLIDYLGSGTSDHPSNFDGTLETHADTIAALLDHLDLRGVDLLGYSMGGTVGIRLALDHPGLVGRLLVAEGNIAPGGGGASRRVIREDRESFAASGLAGLLDELREKGFFRLAEGWAMADPFTFWTGAHELVRLDPGFRDDFQSLSIPLSFLIGENSLAGGPAADAPDPESLRAAGVQVEIVPHAGHAMMYDNPDGFARAVLAALPVGA